MKLKSGGIKGLNRICFVLWKRQEEVDWGLTRYSARYIVAVALLWRVGSAQNHSRMQESPRLFGRRRGHREHGGFGAVRQGSEPLPYARLSWSWRPPKGTYTPGPSWHSYPLSGASQNPCSHSYLLHENFHSDCFPRFVYSNPLTALIWILKKVLNCCV